MNLSVNGQSQVPPGFRFHPTEEELVHYYLRKKVSLDKVDLDVIPDVDLNKLEPWDIQEKCKIGSAPQNDWYLFSHKDKKYPTGTRTNRATAAGFWKATGRDKVIYSNGKRIGMRKTLVFYRGRAPHGLKSDWIMHEYRLDDDNNASDHHYSTNSSDINGGESGLEEGWVVCRVFKKKNYPVKASSQLLDPIASNPPSDNIILDQILNYMERSSSICKQENLIMSNNDEGFLNPESSFSHLPGLVDRSGAMDDMITQIGASSDCVASQLTGHSLKHLGEAIHNEDFSFCFDQDQVQLVNMNVHDSDDISNHEISSLDNDFWAFARSSSSSLSSDPLSHLSV